MRGTGSRSAVGAAVALAAALLATPVAHAADADVDIRDNSFVPGTVEVNVGETVRWSQSGTNPHSVTADDGSFDSHPNCLPACSSQGFTYEQTFDEPGEVPYYCRVHGSPGGSGMAGVIVVRGSGGGGSGNQQGSGSTGNGAGSGSTGDDFGGLPNTGLGSMAPLAAVLLSVALAGRFALRRR